MVESVWSGGGSGKGQKGINSVLRALTMLEILAQNGSPMGVTEIAHMLRLDPSTAYRVLATLVAAGWAIQEPETRRYYLTMKMGHLGRLVDYNDALCRIATPTLQRLAAEYGETAHLAVLDGADVVFVAHRVPHTYLTVNVDLLSRGPSYCTAVGKAMLSRMSDAEIEARLDQVEMKPLAPRTIVSMDGLLKDLARARADGYAVDDEEYCLGVRCVAAPVLDGSGRPMAAIGLTGPSVRLTHERIACLGPATKRAAAELAELHVS
jgi:DNA-binding IclR family transcriptional regulator